MSEGVDGGGSSSRPPGKRFQSEADDAAFCSHLHSAGCTWLAPTMAAQQVTHRQVLVGHNCDSCQKQLRGTFFQCYLCLEVPFRQCRECLNADIKGTTSQRKHKHPSSYMLTQVNFRAYNALDANIGYHCKACPEGENHISGRIFKCNEPHCLDDMFCEACSKTHRCSDNTQEEAASRMIMVPQNYLIGFNPHLETDDGLCRHPLHDDPLPLFQELKWDSCCAVGMAKAISDLVMEVYLVRVDLRRFYFQMLSNIRIEYGCAASFFVSKFKEWMVDMQRHRLPPQLLHNHTLTCRYSYHKNRKDVRNQIANFSPSGGEVPAHEHDDVSR